MIQAHLRNFTALTDICSDVQLKAINGKTA
jgi:hypothetical protein